MTKARLGVAEVSWSRDFISRCASAARSLNLLTEGGCAGCNGTAGVGAGVAAACGGVAVCDEGAG